jgi:hypothetical protein
MNQRNSVIILDKYSEIFKPLLNEVYKNVKQ